MYHFTSFIQDLVTLWRNIKRRDDTFPYTVK